MEAHHGMVDALVKGAAVRVHHIHLPPQVVPVPRPVIVPIQPGNKPFVKHLEGQLLSLQFFFALTSPLSNALLC